MTISRHGVNRHAYGDTQCRPSGGKEIGVAAPPPFFYYKEQEELQLYLSQLHSDSDGRGMYFQGYILTVAQLVY